MAMHQLICVYDYKESVKMDMMGLEAFSYKVKYDCGKDTHCTKFFFVCSLWN